VVEDEVRVDGVVVVIGFRFEDETFVDPFEIWAGWIEGFVGTRALPEVFLPKSE